MNILNATQTVNQKLSPRANVLAGAALALLACASFAGCSRYEDGRAISNPSVATTEATQETASNMTVAADDTPKIEVKPAKENLKHKAKKSHKKSMSRDASISKRRLSPVVKAHKPDKTDAVVDDNSYFYDSELARTDADMINPSENGTPAGAVDARRDFDETVSGTTQAPMNFREDGLSPFAQEPFSRIPATIGSGQLTGKDKSTTFLDGPSLFQDPSALGRELTK